MTQLNFDVVRQRISQYLEKLADSHVSPEPFSTEGTCSFVFGGRFEGKKAVFKFSLTGSTAREAEVLRQFASSSLVPTLYLEQQEWLAQERVSGITWSRAIQEGCHFSFISRLYPPRAWFGPISIDSIRTSPENKSPSIGSPLKTVYPYRTKSTERA